MDARQSLLRDEFSPPISENPNVRKGRFLWMEAEARTTYLTELKKRIASGYFYSERIVDQVVEEIAPIVNDAVDRELQLRY